MKYTVSDYLLERLNEFGVDTIFGIPGDYGFPFMDKIESSSLINWVGNGNELNAAYAADGYARVKGMGAITGSCGVLDLGAASGVAGAFAEHVPLVIISCYPSKDLVRQGVYTHHSLNGNFSEFSNIYQKITFNQVELSSENPCQQIDEILIQCFLKKLPVYISLPQDVQVLQVEKPNNKLIKPQILSNPQQMKDFLSNFNKKLAIAKHPVILADYLVARFNLTNKIEKVANKLNIPLVITNQAHGSGFNEAASFFAGKYSRVTTNQPLKDLVETSDLLIRICLSKDELNTNSANPLVRNEHFVDLQINTAYIDGLYYPQTSLSEILDEMITTKISFSTDFQPLKLAIQDFTGKKDTLISQNRLWEALNSIMRKDDHILLDYGTCQGFAMESSPISTQTIMQSTWSAIGYSLPASLGVQLADPNHRFFEIIGDGGFQETAQDLAAVIQNGLHPIIILLANQNYTIENIVHVNGPVKKKYNQLYKWDYNQFTSALAGKYSVFNASATNEEELVDCLKKAQQAEMKHNCSVIVVNLQSDDISTSLLATMNQLKA